MTTVFRKDGDSFDHRSISDNDNITLSPDSVLPMLIFDTSREEGWTCITMLGSANHGDLSFRWELPLRRSMVGLKKTPSADLNWLHVHARCHQPPELQILVSSCLLVCSQRQHFAKRSMSGKPRVLALQRLRNCVLFRRTPAFFQPLNNI